MSYFQIEESLFTKGKERLLHYLGDVLPHGSGIDTDWLIKMTTPTRIRCSASFHCMDEMGGYDGYVEFTVLIDIHDIDYFNLMFHGNQSQYKAKKYDLRDYLTDTICECLIYAFGEGSLHPPEDYVYND
jgi:hypothetical protein